jgi:heme exporter protein C
MKGRIAFVLLSSALMVLAGYAALFIAPDEKTMHAIQRIFYFHVPSAICAFTAFFVVFTANFAYLGTRDMKWDCLAVAGAEVGVACSTIVLITGPIWAHPVWGIWWTWDARLTSTFVLWLLYTAYLLLRGFLDDPQRKATFTAVFGIFEPSLEDAASTAGDSRRVEFRVGSDDEQSAAAVFGGGAVHGGVFDLRSLPA